jgi:hypothetical protein
MEVDHLLLLEAMADMRLPQLLLTELPWPVVMVLAKVLL